MHWGRGGKQQGLCCGHGRTSGSPDEQTKKTREQEKGSRFAVQRESLRNLYEWKCQMLFGFGGEVIRKSGEIIRRPAGLFSLFSAISSRKTYKRVKRGGSGKTALFKQGFSKANEGEGTRGGEWKGTHGGRRFRGGSGGECSSPCRSSWVPFLARQRASLVREKEKRKS